MRLRTRIALVFILLLAAVLAVSLSIVSAGNRHNTEREIKRQLDVGTLVFSRVLETNRRELIQAAQALASDSGFREAVAMRDTGTVESALEDSGARIGATMVVLVSLDGNVITNSGSRVQKGTRFEPARLLKAKPATDKIATMMVENGHVYQLVMVPVRSPLPVAWIAMGVELDSDAARELADITGLGVTLAFGGDGRWTNAASTVTPDQSDPADRIERRLQLSADQNAKVVAILSHSLSEARTPFERLANDLYLVAIVSLLASGAAAFLLARNITRPLQSLTEAVDHVRLGRYAMPLNVHRRDELGVLAEGLQLMQHAVRSREQSMRQLAYADSLTGLQNRTAFGITLESALADHRKDSTIAVALINVERFRRINECLGHSVGDEVLKSIALRLTAAPSVADTVARLAADEFIAIVRIEGAATAQSWGAILLERLKEPISVQSQPIDISATVGIALAPEHATASDELMRCADLALERARSAKRSLALYEPALKRVARDQLSMLSDLRHAVEEDQLVLYYQPKVDFDARRVAGVEVLMRWQHPTRGLLAPGAFVPFAEQTGFIRRLTRWALDKAAAQGAAWVRAGTPLPVAVNISADDIADPLLDQRVAAALAKHNLPPALLTLEVTESGFIDDPARALQMLESLAALGVRLSIDDFGTGYSSLSYLARMPVDEVKIDRSFVQGLETDRDFASVVRAAIDMGHSLGLKVVAEGIETEIAASRLAGMDCDLAQGYLFAKPMPAEELERWLVGRERVPVIAVHRQFNVEDAGLLDATDVLRPARSAS